MKKHTHNWILTGEASYKYTRPLLLQQKCSCGVVRWVDGDGIPTTKKAFLSERRKSEEKYPPYFDKAVSNFKRGIVSPPINLAPFKRSSPTKTQMKTLKQQFWNAREALCLVIPSRLLEDYKKKLGDYVYALENKTKNTA
jgi:hypothetical protein